jgi:hypothetical protein
MKKLCATLAWILWVSLLVARTDVANDSNTTLMFTGCPNCQATDLTGLSAYAVGHPSYGTPSGWDVWVNPTELLIIANGVGVNFTVLGLLPGKTFNITSFKLFGLSARYKTTGLSRVLWKNVRYDTF